jgi:beta-ribofuranosylaminobenzene 5'-phosphate synthase
MITIKTPSRIHMTLIDLNAELGRMDGGIGLALDEPFIELKAEDADEIKVNGPLKERAKDSAGKVIEALEIDGGVKIEVASAYSSHVGLGSGTQVGLAAGVAVCRLYDRDVPVNEIAKMIGRGGTSGIGVATFQNGGFILDGGHSIKEKRDFLPSAASRASPPPILARYDFPDWKIALVMPKSEGEFSGEREVGIFQKFCPIPRGDVERLSRLILMKILPSVLEDDISAFGDGINEIQEIGFKAVEVSLQPPEVKELMNECREFSYGVGLSSFGPAIYCAVKDEHGLKNALKGKAKIIVTKANNEGAEING